MLVPSPGFWTVQNGDFLCDAAAAADDDNDDDDEDHSKDNKKKNVWTKFSQSQISPQREAFITEKYQTD